MSDWWQNSVSVVASLRMLFINVLTEKERRKRPSKLLVKGRWRKTKQRRRKRSERE